MNTYPLEEKYALVITPELASVILLQDALESGCSEFPDEVRKALDAGTTPWGCASDPVLFRALADNDWANTSAAFEVVQEAGDSDTVYCSEFTGGTAVPPEFAKYGGSEENLDDEYIAGLVPLRAPEMFKAAYGSPDELLQEYRDRLENLAGPDVPVGRFVRNVSGTYFC